MVAVEAVSKKQQADDGWYTPPTPCDAVHQPGKPRKASSSKDNGAQPSGTLHMSRIPTAAYKHYAQRTHTQNAAVKTPARQHPRSLRLLFAWRHSQSWQQQTSPA
jgi:hypothetical protein